MNEGFRLEIEEWRVQIAIGLLIAVALWRLAEANEKQAYHLGRIDRRLTEESPMLRQSGYDIPVDENESDDEDDPDEEEWAMGDRSVPDGIVDEENEVGVEDEPEGNE